jgi:Tol biopolymer transport system component
MKNKTITVVLFAVLCLSPGCSNPTIVWDLLAFIEKFTVKEIVPNTGINFYSRFSFSPDGQSLLFDNSKGKKIYRSPDSDSNPALGTIIYKLNLKNLHKQELSGGSEPVFSPDGTKIAFCAEGISKYCRNIYIMDPESQNIRRLTKNKFDDFGPYFSPDGASLVFGRNTGRGGAGLIILVDINSGTEREIYRFKDKDFLGNPCFFDSNTIIIRPGKYAFVHYLSKPQPGAIYSFEGESGDDPVYSSDRTKTAFIRWARGVRDIFIGDSKGRNPRQITYTKNPKEVKSFSPDGKSIIFISSEKGTACDWELWQVDIDGSNLKRIKIELP